jgi:hypothetical protein
LAPEGNPLPPHLTPGWFAEHFHRGEEREQYFQRLGSDPELCPDYAAFRAAHRQEFELMFLPLAIAASEAALAWRARLGVTGRPTEADAWRLVELAGWSVGYADVVMSHVVRLATGQVRLVFPERPSRPCPVEEIVGRLAGYVWGAWDVPALETAWPGTSLPLFTALENVRERIAVMFEYVWLDGEAK